MFFMRYHIFIADCYCPPCKFDSLDQMNSNEIRHLIFVRRFYDTPHRDKSVSICGQNCRNCNAEDSNGLKLELGAQYAVVSVVNHLA